MDFTTVWRFNPGTPAIAIGNMHLEPLSNSKHYIIGAYWNHIVQGQIQNKICEIILNDTTNPVQIKK